MSKQLQEKHTSKNDVETVIEEKVTGGTENIATKTAESKRENHNQNEMSSNKVANVATKNDITQKTNLIPIDVKEPNQNTLGNKAPINIGYVDEVNESGEQIKIQILETEIDGTVYKQKIPSDFIVDENNGFLYNWKLNKSGEIVSTLLSDFPIIITGSLENIEVSENNQEKLELAMFRNNNWQKKIYPKQTLYNKPTELSNDGVKITSANAKLFTQYIIYSEIENKTSIPIIYTKNNLGWTRDNKDFVPFSDNIKSADINLLERYESKGTLEEWTSSIAEYRQNDIFRFILSGAFSASLLKLVNERPFIIYNYATSRSGKTALLTIALSAFGNPEKLITSFNTTRVGLEKLLTLNSHLPVAIDERQIADNQHSVENMVFMIANQTGRVRRY